MDNDSIHKAVLEAVEASLSAQIKAIRSLRRAKETSGSQLHSSSSSSRKKGMSHLDMAQDILVDAAAPLHVNEIISRIKRRFGVRVDRESLVSALSKRVVRQDRFERTGKNTFALIKTDTANTSSHD
ncbi:MAG: hypothetical protein ACK5LK_04485 [Chthoniobacterales bacterium]